MSEPLRKYYLSYFFLPSGEKLRDLVERERHLVLSFPSCVPRLRKEKLVRKIENKMPENFSVFDAGSRKYWSYITIMQVISKAEASSIVSEIKFAANEFRRQSEWLATKIAELNNVSATELWDRSDEIEVFPIGWECYHHGQHFCCKNIHSSQVVEVPIWYGEEFGILDPYFFAQFIDTTQSLNMPIGIIDWYHDMSRVMDLMLGMGLFKKIIGTRFGVSGIVIT